MIPQFNGVGHHGPLHTRSVRLPRRTRNRPNNNTHHRKKGYRRRRRRIPCPSWDGFRPVLRVWLKRRGSEDRFPLLGHRPHRHRPLRPRRTPRKAEDPTHRHRTKSIVLRPNQPHLLVGLARAVVIGVRKNDGDPLVDSLHLHRGSLLRLLPPSGAGVADPPQTGRAPVQRVLPVLFRGRRSGAVRGGGGRLRDAPDNRGVLVRAGGAEGGGGGEAGGEGGGVRFGDYDAGVLRRLRAENRRGRDGGGVDVGGGGAGCGVGVLGEGCKHSGGLLVL
ncbi:hypothetical protein U1Q18_009536 [Sarracenia purpurea var. burkii]